MHVCKEGDWNIWDGKLCYIYGLTCMILWHSMVIGVEFGKIRVMFTAGITCTYVCVLQSNFKNCKFIVNAESYSWNKATVQYFNHVNGTVYGISIYSLLKRLKK